MIFIKISQVIEEKFVKLVTSEIVGCFSLFLEGFSRAKHTVHQTYYTKLEFNCNYR